MRSRKLRHRIQWFGYEQVSDGCGGRVTGYNAKGKTWCDMKPFGSNDKNQGGRFEQPYIDQQNTTVKNYTTKLRKLCGFTPLDTDIILFHGRYLEVTAITDIDEEDFGYFIHLSYFATNEYTILDQAGLFNVDGDPIYNIQGELVYNILGEVS